MRGRFVWPWMSMMVFMMGCPKTAPESVEAPSTSVPDVSEEPEVVAASEANPIYKIKLTNYNTLDTCAIEDDSSEEAEQASIAKAQEVFAANQDQVQACFEAFTGILYGPESVEYQITDGIVQSVTFSEEFATSTAAGCVREKVLTWTFLNNCSDTGSFKIWAASP